MLFRRNKILVTDFALFILNQMMIKWYLPNAHLKPNTFAKGMQDKTVDLK